jgi:hypothetical protein
VADELDAFLDADDFDAFLDAPADAAADAPTQPGIGQRIFSAAREASPALDAVIRLPENITAGERALLTNEPVQSFGEGVLRGTPAAIGGTIGGATGLVAGAPLTIGALATSAGGAALGGGAGEAARQAVAQTYSAFTGRGRVQRPDAVVRDVGVQSALQIPGQVMNLGTGLLAKYYGNRLPSMLKQFVGTPEPITQYTQKRGADAVFMPANLDEGAALANVGQATTDLAARRSAIGSQIGQAEEAVLSKIGDKAPALRHIREGLDDALYARGITDPKTAGLARSREAGLLQRLKEVLTPDEVQIPDPTGLGITTKTQTEKLTLRQALNAKRLIDENLEFAEKELSTPTEQLLKRVNHQIRESVRADMGPEVGKLWDDFGAIADAQEKLAEFTGTRALSNVEQRAVQSLRGIMLKNPGEVDNIVKVLGAGLPGGEAQARQIFDSIAADAFTKGAIGAPSSTMLKTLTAGGALSGPAARGMVRFGETLNRSAANPVIPAGVYGPGLTPLAEAYIRQRPAQ